MVNQGIVLGHIISSRGIEVDKAKIELISKLPSPTNVKTVRQFLGHAGFYRRFIKDFLKIAKPVTPQTIFLNDFFSWNLSFRCFMVHHEFIIIFRNYFSIKWNFRKIYPVRSNSEQL